MGTNNVDKWVTKFSNNKSEDVGKSHADLGKEVFARPERTWMDEAVTARDVSHNIGMGMMTAPVEAAAGAIGLVNKDASDYLKSKVRSVEDFQNRNVPGAAYSLNPEEQANSKLFGQVLGGVASQGAFVPDALAKGGPIAQGALAGTIGGLMQRQEGDSVADTAGLGLAGAGFGASGAAVGSLAGKIAGTVPSTFTAVKDIYNKVVGKTDDAAFATATNLDKAFKTELYGAYKELGIKPKGMTPAELVKHKAFVSKFAFGYNKQVSAQFDTALSEIAPDEVVDFVNFTVPPETRKDAINIMMDSVDPLNIKALKNPQSLLYYQQLQKSMRNSLKGGDGSGMMAEDIMNVMKSKSPAYVKALDMYDTKQILKTQLPGNFYQAIQTDRSMIPAAMEFIGTGDGKEVIDTLFINGMGSALRQNSNKPAMIQLSKSLGNSPEAQQNTLDFLRQVGSTDLAEKFDAISGFVNTVERANAVKGTSGKFLGASIKALPQEELANGLSNILKANTKWSKEFTKIIGQQRDSLQKSELIANLLKRASAVVPSYAGTARDNSKTPTVDDILNQSGEYE